MRVRKSRDERRLEVVETTLRLAARLGPDRITAEAIAQELGVSQPAVFRHFPRKDDIWTATIDWLGDSLQQAWERSAEGVAAAELLPALVAAHLAFVESHPAVPLVLLSPELQARHESVRQATARLMGLFHARLGQALERGRTAGAYGEDLDPARAAWMLLAIIQGVALRWTASRQAFDLRAEGLALVGMAVAGIARR
ncbi:MAG: TetR/AcrR family transcriptional regulator [Solirubrobacterales bacterium]